LLQTAITWTPPFFILPSFPFFESPFPTNVRISGKNIFPSQRSTLLESLFLLNGIQNFHFLLPCWWLFYVFHPWGGHYAKFLFFCSPIFPVLTFWPPSSSDIPFDVYPLPPAIVSFATAQFPLSFLIPPNRDFPIFPLNTPQSTEPPPGLGEMFVFCRHKTSPDIFSESAFSAQVVNFPDHFRVQRAGSSPPPTRSFNLIRFFFFLVKFQSGVQPLLVAPFLRPIPLSFLTSLLPPHLKVTLISF